MACKSAGLYGGSLPESGGLSGKCDDGSPFVVGIFIADGDMDAVTSGICVGVVAVVIAVTDNVIAVVQLLATLVLIPLLDATCPNGSNGPKSSASLSMPPMKSARPASKNKKRIFWFSFFFLSFKSCDASFHRERKFGP